MGCRLSSPYSVEYNADFFDAVTASKNGDIKKVKKYFQANKNTLLIHTLFEKAVEYKQMQVIDFLLSHGVVQGRYNDFSIRYLTPKAHKAREKMLDVHLASEDELKVLPVYAFTDVFVGIDYDFEIVKKIILEANYNYHSFNDYLLRIACFKKDLQMIQFFVSENKIPKNKDVLNKIFFEMCTEAKYTEVIRILFQIKKFHWFNLKQGLYFAVIHRNESAAKLLLSKKACFGNLREFTTKEMTFVKYLQRPRQVEAAKKIQNWWIPICYDMKRECGKRMFERNYKAYEESLI